MTTPTTTATPTPAGPTAPRPLPLYASVPLILACLAAGGYIIHWYVGSRVRADEPHLLAEVPAAPARPDGPAPHVAIRRQDGNGVTYEAVTPKATILCQFAKSKWVPPRLVALRYGGGANSPFRTLPLPVQQTLDNGRRLSRNEEALTALKLTDQRQRLQDLSNPPGMAVTDADRTTLVADFKAYQSVPADKPDQEKAAAAKLMADVDVIADHSADASRQQAADHAAKINALVTPDQWRQFHTMGG